MSDYSGWGEETKVLCQKLGCRNAVDITKGTIFCDGCVTAQIAQDHLWEQAAKEEPIAERLERLRTRVKDMATDPEKFYHGLTDKMRLNYDDRVLGEILNTHAKQAARDAMNPLVPWSDTKEIEMQGRPERKPPTVMPYQTPFGDDEVGLLYMGAINTIFGNAEVGKSLLNYAIHAWFINQGKHTVHLEFDNNLASEIFWRVVDAGADQSDVVEYLHIAEMPGSIPTHDFEVSYVSLDCVNAAIAFMGGEANSSGSGTDQMYEKYLTPFVLKGACALALDHVGHADKTRASNSIRKIQAVSGIAYCMEAVNDGGKMGEKWYSKLTPTKDRPGGGPAKGLTAAYIEFDGTVGHGLCEVTVTRDLAGGADLVIPDKIKDQDSRLLFGIISATGDIALSTTEILRAYKDKGGESSDSTVKGVLRLLVNEGMIGGEKTNAKSKTSPWKFWAVEPEETSTE